jgi:hypothetical protein
MDSVAARMTSFFLGIKLIDLIIELLVLIINPFDNQTDIY